MLTHFIKSINWVDVALVILLVRVIFIGVKNGFIAEVCKFLGVFLALYISLHYYVIVASKIHGFTHGSLPLWEFIVFLILVSGGYGLFWAIRLGLAQLFKAETQHEGFDKYAAGLLSIGRGFLTASLVVFAVLLTNHPWLQSQAFHSVAYKLVGKTAPHTYSLVFHQVIDKLFAGQHFNSAVYQVVSESDPITVRQKGHPRTF